MDRSQKTILAALAITLLVTWAFVALFYGFSRGLNNPAGRFDSAFLGAGQSDYSRPDLPATWTLTPVNTFTPSPTPLPAVTATPPLPLDPLVVARPTSLPPDVTPSFVHPSSTLPIPTAIPLASMPADVITILLLGSDQRPDWNDWHTDSIQYVVIYPEIPSVAILSIPRDLYVYIPGYWMSRINFADMYGDNTQFDGGGFGLLNQTLLYNLGISADHYALVDFDGLIGLVDNLGGIDVPVHCRLEDYWPYPDENGEYPWFVLQPGLHHMDGETALWYARSRKTTSVFAREQRQQQVLTAMWRRGRELDLLNEAPALYEESRDLFETDLNLAQILSLAVTAAQLEAADIHTYNVGAGDVTPYTTPYGGGVFLPRSERIAPLIENVLAPPAVNRASQDRVVVEIWNNTPYEGWEYLAADRLSRYNFTPVIGSSSGQDTAQTTLVILNPNDKVNRAAHLQTLLAIPAANVVSQPVENPTAPLRLILGRDYQPCW